MQNCHATVRILERATKQTVSKRIRISVKEDYEIYFNMDIRVMNLYYYS